MEMFGCVRVQTTLKQGIVETPEVPMVALFVLLTIITFVVIDFFVQRAARKKLAAIRVRSPLLLDRFVIPKGFFLSKGHAWIEVLASGKTRIGVDDFVQKLVGSFDGIALQPVGSTVRKGDPLVTLRQGERMLTIPAPLTGTLLELNEEVLEDASGINADPYGSGWIAVLEPTNLAAELPSSAIAAAASQWLRGEIRRFKEFIAEYTSRSTAMPAGVTLADGGVPVAGVLRLTDDAAWDQFKRSFILSSETPDRKESRQ